MPCRDDYDTPNLTITTKSNGYNELQRRLDLATRVACNAMSVIEDFGWHDPDGEIAHVINNNLTTESKDWFKAHQEADLKRKEALKASAKAKLTAEEREALGL